VGPYELLADWSTWGWPLLANHLWQATLFSLLALAASSLLKRAPAGARYHVWLFALIKFALPSAVLTFLIGQAGLDLSRLAPAGLQTSPTASSLPLILSPVASPPALSRAAEAPARGDEPPAPALTVAPRGTNHLYSLMTCLWLAGCAVLLAFWLRRRLQLSAALRRGGALSSGREVEALRRVQTWMGLRRDIRLVVTPAVSEPGVWRAFRPVIVLPEGVADQLDDAELEAVLMHEVSHVERRDNLVGNLQRALCCLFWFHPVVWLIDRRLLAEREQACDDVVVRLSGASDVYATSIAKVCGHCLGWNVAGLSSFAGSDLKRRIERIVSDCAGKRLSSLQQMLVAAAAAGAVAFSVVAGQVHVGQVADRGKGGGEVSAGGRVEAGERVRAQRVSGPAERPRESAAGPRDAKEIPAPAAHVGEGSATPVEVKAPPELIENTAATMLDAAVLLREAERPAAEEPPPPAPVVATGAAIVRAADVDYGDLRKFTGRYEVDPTKAENFVLDITLEGGELWLKPSHASRRRLIRQSEANFSDAYSEFRLTAIQDEGGRVVGLKLNSWGRNVTARRLKLPAPSAAGRTTFRLKGHHSARIVAVAGTFNNWNQSQLLFAREGDEWVCRVNLPPGTHQYKFIVDGNWLADPSNSKTVHDERGILNSLLSTE